MWLGGRVSLNAPQSAEGLPASHSDEWSWTSARKNAGQAAPRERSALIRGRCALLAPIVIFHAPRTVGSSKLQQSPRWQSGTGLHNPVSAIPCTNKQWVTSEHCDWVMILETCGENTQSFWEKAAHGRATGLQDSAWMQMLHLSKGAVKMLFLLFLGIYAWKPVHRCKLQPCIYR